MLHMSAAVQSVPRLSTPAAAVPWQAASDPLLGAAEVHRALCIPPRMHTAGWEVASRILPHRGVSGDFVVRVDRPGGTLLAIGDLMGKGLSAAMWLTHVIDLLQRAAEPFDSLSAVLARVNAEVHRSRVGAPLTSLCALDLPHDSKRMTVAVAGHPPALLLANGGKIRPLSDGGPLLGALPSATYHAAEIELAPGDSVVAFSDGLSESRNEDGDEFGRDGIVHCLRQRRRSSAHALAEGLLACAREFARREPCDDVTVLVVQCS